jgi:integrase
MPLSKRRHRGGGNWHIRGSLVVWRDGVRETVPFPERTTGTDCADEADAIIGQIEAAARRGHYTDVAPEPLFGQLIAAYLDGGGQARYLAPVARRLGPLKPSQIVQELLDREGREEYPGVRPQTLRRCWHGPVIAILNAAKIPHALARPAAGRRRVRWLRPDQAEAVIRAAVAGGRYRNPWAATLVLFLLGTGARLSEALLLDAADLHLDYRCATLRDTKNGTDRVVFLPPRAVAALSLLPSLRTPGPVFRNTYGRPYAVRADSGTDMNVIRSAVARAGLDPERWTAHTFRHTWATWYYAATRDMVALQARGGWSSLAMVQTYAHLAPPMLAADLARHNWDFTESLPSPLAGEGTAHA